MYSILSITWVACFQYKRARQKTALGVEIPFEHSETLRQLEGSRKGRATFRRLHTLR